MGRFASLCQVIDRIADHPGGPAVLRFHDGKVEILDGEELLRRVQRLSASLVQAGLTPGERVAIQADNCIEWILSCLAVLRAGGVVTPLDTQLGHKETERLLRDSRPRFLFTSSLLAEHPALSQWPDAPRLLLFDNPQDPRFWRYLPASADFPPAEPAPEDVAVLFYTSGTTGAPKGVPLSHENLIFQINRLLEIGLIDQTDRVLLPLPLHHVYPFAVGLLLPLAVGAPIILPEGLTGPRLIEALQKGRATALLGVPRLYEALCQGLSARMTETSWPVRQLVRIGMGLSAGLGHRLGVHWGRWLMAPVRRALAPALRILASGGAPLDPELARRLDVLGWQIAIGYGLTETSPLLTLLPPGDVRFDSVGRPLEGVELRIESLSEEAEPGAGVTAGEVLVRGAGVFAGYRNLPELSEEIFTADGWFRTGDLGRLDDKGYLTLEGRKSSLIVTPSGKNIQPEELEETYGQSPLIAEIGVLQKDGRLVAVAVPDPERVADSGDKARREIRVELRRIASGLPSYRHLSGFLLHERPLERTRLGKLQRHRLRALYEELHTKQAGEKPRPAEKPAVDQFPAEDRDLLLDPRARAVWDLLVRRFPDRSLIPDSCLDTDLGFDSLTWVEMSLRISEAAGVELDSEEVGGLETVHDLLEAVVRAEQTTGRLKNPLETPETFLDPEQRKWTEPLGPAAAVTARFGYALNRFLMKNWFPIRVSGLENIPEQEPWVLAPNHLSVLDPLLVAAVLDNDRLRRTFWAGWKGIAFRNRFFRFISRLSQTFPIDPTGAPIPSLALGALVLREGGNLVWFPEGRRSPDGRLLPFQSGLGLLLNYFDASVVPVAIVGTDQALPRKGLFPRRRPLGISFGKALTKGELLREGEGDLPPDRIMSALRERLTQLLEDSAAGDTPETGDGG
jgi:long-chain acyl-CoA synthetase